MLGGSSNFVEWNTCSIPPWGRRNIASYQLNYRNQDNNVKPWHYEGLGLTKHLPSQSQTYALTLSSQVTEGKLTVDNRHLPGGGWPVFRLFCGPPGQGGQLLLWVGGWSFWGSCWVGWDWISLFNKRAEIKFVNYF